MISNTIHIFDDTISFEDKLNHVYRYQLTHNKVYETFVSHFSAHNKEFPGPDEIPLLPVKAFKDAKLIAEGMEASVVFKSSGTGNMNRSRHFVADTVLYAKAVETGFSTYFDPDGSVILCYTPGYNQNRDSSLLWMLNHLIGLTNDSRSRFLPLNEPLSDKELADIAASGKQLILFGAAFGLADLVEQYNCKLPPGSVIIETGGMKTHRREISKTELRKLLSGGFSIPVDQIHSEYGMCELMSQCYAIGDEWFKAPEWLRVTIRDASNPGRICNPGEEGKIGVIDLANIYSCPFILTEDRGVMDTDGRFKVLGRWHAAEMRGCNFLIDRD